MREGKGGEERVIYVNDLAHTNPQFSQDFNSVGGVVVTVTSASRSRLENIYFVFLEPWRAIAKHTWGRHVLFETELP